MANNEYVNKVLFGNSTIMDISDTTAEAGDVIQGQIFYTKSGAPTTGSLGDATQSMHGLMSATDKIKLDSLATVSLTGDYSDLLNKPDLSQYLTSVPTMAGATSNANGTSGLVPAPLSSDLGNFLSADGTWKPGGKPMVVLSYGTSTWADFIAAYNDHVIVYCKASSNSNPATGSQTRQAFMAYVNADPPTSVEFQYYRSMSSHTSSQMSDEVYIYKLDKTSGWSVTVRQASLKQIAIDTNDAATVSFSSNKITLKGGLPKVTADDNGKILQVVNGVWTAVTPS